ncbi:MAG: hypothetical protein KGD64_14215 [Candidatus Heimdallarchaeota archaeon]|nr:hypothetical protein [Candidatus Heimdallarchaeota archaeon]
MQWKKTSKKWCKKLGIMLSWIYDPDRPEYLINVLTYSLKEDLMEAQFGKDCTDADEEEFDVLYATVSLDLAKINPTYWASLLKMKEIIETAMITIIGNL